MRFHKSFVIAMTMACAAVSTNAQTATKPATSAATKKGAAPATARKSVATPMTEDDKTIYAIGLSIYHSLARLDLSPAELEIVKRALSDAAAGKPAVDIKTYGPKIQTLEKTRVTRASSRFLEKAAAEPGAVKTPSGLIYKELKAGTGASPAATDKVKVNYRGTFTDGQEFDSSYARNEPAEFALNGVIPCWTEGVQKMKAGGKARLVCPSDIAYGDRGNQGIPGGSTLVFEIELLSVAGK
jgi:FKBP-type peptidyl-prolyl cis-trans isomerase FkpA